MKDFSKCGLTCPHELLEVLLEAIDDRLPEELKINCPKFYSNTELWVDDEIVRPKRGYILGMANFLFTLVQIVIFKMGGITRYLVGNDDSLVISDENGYDLDWDEEITRQLGLSLSEKMFRASEGIFFEEYSDEIFEDRKEILF